MPEARCNGIRLVYEQHGSGPDVVLLHGAQGDRSMFAGLIGDLADGHRLLAFDQRHSGQSDHPDAPTSMDLIADDTAALMDEVGIDSACILGVSMGGMVAQAFALRHPQRTRSLVLGCTTPGGPRAWPLVEDSLQRAYGTGPMSAEQRGRALAETCFTAGYLERHPQTVEAMIELRRNRPMDTAALARRMAAVHAHDTLDRLGAISCPTLVITGRDDVLIPWQNSELIAAAIGGAELVVLEPAGHLFWVEQREATLQALRRFTGCPGG